MNYEYEKELETRVLNFSGTFTDDPVDGDLCIIPEGNYFVMYERIYCKWIANRTFKPQRGCAGCEGTLYAWAYDYIKDIFKKKRYVYVQPTENQIEMIDFDYLRSVSGIWNAVPTVKGERVIPIS